MTAYFTSNSYRVSSGIFRLVAKVEGENPETKFTLKRTGNVIAHKFTNLIRKCRDWMDQPVVTRLIKPVKQVGDLLLSVLINDACCAYPWKQLPRANRKHLS